MRPGRLPKGADRSRVAVLGRPSDMTEEACGSLEVYRQPEDQTTLSVWEMSWRERFAALFFGRVWVWVHSGGVTQPPLAMTSTRTVFVPRKGPIEERATLEEPDEVEG